jgi:hypothetical protein
MGKIYAPLDAVNHRKTIKTVVPGDIDLTTAQKRELYDVEGLYLTGRDVRATVANSENPGIHFFALENGLVVDLANNPHISPLVAFLLARKTPKRDDYMVSMYYNYFSRMASNPTVIQTPGLLKGIVDGVISRGEYDVLAVIYSSFAITIARGEASDVASTVMLLKLWQDATSVEDFRANVKLGKSNQMGITDRLINWVTGNQDEFLKYLADTNDDLSDLPVSWVLEAWGFGTSENDLINQDWLTTFG